MDSVAYYILVQPNQFAGKVAQVCRGLIEGVAYLHKFRIAHRDIKPDNLVVDKNLSLKIIDFDAAMQVDGEDDVADGQCGTDGWMAPEMKEKRVYSPIKIDRWSTGQVLLYLLNKFRKEDAVLRKIARKLTAHNPEQRWSMFQAAASLLDTAYEAVERKAWQSQQDKMKENVQANVLSSKEKSKLTVPDRVVLGDLLQQPAMW